MAITITLPGPGPVFQVGPGAPISLSSNFVGPFPANSTWRITVSTDLEGNNAVWGCTLPIQDHTASVRWGDNVFPDQATGNTMAAENADVFVLATVFQPGNVVIDSGSTGAKYQPTSLLWDLDLIIQRRIAQGGTALTPAQDTALTSSSVSGQLALDGQQLSQLAAGVADALTRPPYYFQCTDPPITGQSGTGSLVPPIQTRTSIVTGLTWLFTTVPPFVGRRGGFITRYAGTPLQLVAQYQLNHNAGQSVWGEVTEWDYDNGIWIFRSLFPTSIGFSIQPGFVAQFQWVRFCLLP